MDNPYYEQDKAALLTLLRGIKIIKEHAEWGFNAAVGRPMKLYLQGANDALGAAVNVEDDIDRTIAALDWARVHAAEAYRIVDAKLTELTKDEVALNTGRFGLPDTNDPAHVDYDRS